MVPRLCPDLHRDDLLAEPSLLLGFERLAVTAGRKIVLCLAREFVFCSAQLGVRAHMHIPIGIPESILNDAVHELAVSHLVSRPGFFQQIGRSTHALHPCRHHHLSRT